MGRLSVVGTLPVAATPERAWDVWSRVEDWPRWDWMGSADAGWVEGPRWTAGSVLRFGHRPWTFDCVLLIVNPPGEVVWEGRGVGFHGRHAMRFLPHPRGCLLQTSEVFSGPGARALRPLIRWFWHHQLHAFRRHVERHG